MKRAGRTPWSWAVMAALSLLPFLVGQGCPPLAGDGQGTPDGVEDVTPPEAAALIESHLGDPDFVILDVRTLEEYNAGHLEGAVSLCVLCQSPDFLDAAISIGKSKTYLVYCRTGRRSVTAVTIMAENGFPNLYNMTGGITQWISDGLPVVQ